MDWADLGPKISYFLLGQTRPRRQGWARISLAQQQSWWGELFSPHPPAERYSFCMQRKQPKHKK